MALVFGPVNPQTHKKQLNLTNRDANVSFEFSRLRACALQDVGCDFVSCGYLNTSKDKIKLLKKDY